VDSRGRSRTGTRGGQKGGGDVQHPLSPLGGGEDFWISLGGGARGRGNCAPPGWPKQGAGTGAQRFLKPSKGHKQPKDGRSTREGCTLCFPWEVVRKGLAAFWKPAWGPIDPGLTTLVVYQGVKGGAQKHPQLGPGSPLDFGGAEARGAHLGPVCRGAGLSEKGRTLDFASPAQSFSKKGVPARAGRSSCRGR